MRINYRRIFSTNNCNLFFLMVLEVIIGLSFPVVGLYAQETIVFGQKGRYEDLLQHTYQVDKLVILDSSVINISNYDFVNISAKKTFIGKGCKIVGVRQPGNKGPTAPNVQPVGSCAHGNTGLNGYKGMDGQNGSNLVLDLGIIEELGSLDIDLSGSSGGEGGQGGEGGKGGDATCSCSSGDGGTGGKGGTGGTGGTGGNLTMIYCQNIGVQPILSNSIKVHQKGGMGGAPGKGGMPGPGGQGHEKCGIFPYFKMGSGSNGQLGLSGNSGDGNNGGTLMFKDSHCLENPDLKGMGDEIKTQYKIDSDFTFGAKY